MASAIESGIPLETALNMTWEGITEALRGFADLKKYRDSTATKETQQKTQGEANAEELAKRLAGTKPGPLDLKTLIGLR